MIKLQIPKYFLSVLDSISLLHKTRQCNTFLASTLLVLFVSQVQSFALSIDTGGYTTQAVTNSGDRWAWGDNDIISYYGDGSSFTRISPHYIESGYIKAVSGGSFGFGLKSDGTLWAWGYNGNGVLGDGTTTGRPLPVHIGSNFIDVSTSHFGHTMALKRDGSLWTWGTNYFGELGDGTTEAKSTPQQIGSNFVAISAGTLHCLAIKTDGTLWAWGSNGGGQIGDDTTTDRHAPVQVGSGFAQISAGSFNLAIDNSGQLWSWGSNSHGQLGDGTTTSRYKPILVGTGFSQVAAGDSHSIGLKNDGTVWSWGFNYYGALGNGQTTDSRIPVYVGGGYLLIAADGMTSFAVKNDGTLWAWGLNTRGVLGLNTNGGDAFYVPTQVPGENGNGFLNLLDGVTGNDIYMTEELHPELTLPNLSGSVGNNYIYKIKLDPSTQGSIVKTTGGSGCIDLYSYYSKPSSKYDYINKSTGQATEQELTIPSDILSGYILVKSNCSFSGVSLTVAPIRRPVDQSSSGFNDIVLKQNEIKRYTLNMSDKYRNMDLIFNLSQGDIGASLDSDYHTVGDNMYMEKLSENSYRLRLANISSGKHPLEIIGAKPSSIFSISLQTNNNKLVPVSIFGLLLK